MPRGKLGLDSRVGASQNSDAEIELNLPNSNDVHYGRRQAQAVSNSMQHRSQVSKLPHPFALVHGLSDLLDDCLKPFLRLCSVHRSSRGTARRHLHEAEGPVLLCGL
jgi:hypothetical protein